MEAAAHFKKALTFIHCSEINAFKSHRSITPKLSRGSSRTIQTTPSVHSFAANTAHRRGPTKAAAQAYHRGVPFRDHGEFIDISSGPGRISAADPRHTLTDTCLVSKGIKLSQEVELERPTEETNAVVGMSL